MYPRLKLARDLLTDDGIIFISIDDHEVHNLRKICDEIYGENNFISLYIWRKKTGASDAKNIAVITEYILCYAKNEQFVKFDIDEKGFDEERYRYEDEFVKERGKHYIDNLDRGGIRYSDSLNYAIKCPDGTYTYPNGRTEFKNDGWTWTWGKDKLKWGIENGFIVFKESSNKKSGWGVYYKNYLKVNNKNEGIKKGVPYKNIISNIINTEATKEIDQLFSSKVFQYTKPTRLIITLLKQLFLKDSIILDFFSGSATTAHAVMQLNAEDGGNRKYIMVQLDEETDEKSEAYKAGYKYITDIGEERIRRAAKKIKEETNADIDYGFRVYKLDSSNMNDVYYKPDEYKQDQLGMFEDNIKEDRSDLDILTQVMLDLGLTLDLKIAEKEINGHKVYFVENNSLIASFSNITDISTIDEMCKDKPLKLVFRESSFKTDEDKINIQERVKKLSPETEISIL